MLIQTETNNNQQQLVRDSDNQSSEFYNPFAVTQDSHSDKKPSNPTSSDDDDEEADFAQVSDLVGNTKINLGDDGPKAQEMATTAAFRMSTNDDLKKTANWSSAKQDSPDLNQWSPGQADSKNPTNPYVECAQQNSQTANKSPLINVSSTQAEKLLKKQVDNQHVKKVVSKPNGKSKAASKIISASSVTFIKNSNTSPQQVTQVAFNYQNAPLASNKQIQKNSNSFLDRMQLANQEVLIRSEQIKSSAMEYGVEMNSFDVAQMTGNKMDLSNTTDPLQQTFAQLNTSEASESKQQVPNVYNNQHDQQDINPFSLSVNNQFSVEDVSLDKTPTPLLEGALAGFGPQSNLLVQTQLSEQYPPAVGQFGSQEQTVSNQAHPYVPSQMQKANNILNVQKQQNSANHQMRGGQRFSLGGGSIKSKDNTASINLVQRSGVGSINRFSDASSKKSISGNSAANNAQSVYRMKRSQINDLKAKSQNSGSKNSHVGSTQNENILVTSEKSFRGLEKESISKTEQGSRQQSRGRVVTSTTAANSSENVLSRASARRGSNQRQNSHPPLQQQHMNNQQIIVNSANSQGSVAHLKAQRFERENRLRQFGANSLKPMSSEGPSTQLQVISQVAHNDSMTSPGNTSSRYGNQVNATYSQGRPAPVLVAPNPRLKEFQEVFSPTKLIQNASAPGRDDARRLNSQQWNSDRLQLVNNSHSAIVHHNPSSPNGKHGLQPRMSSKYQLGGNPFEQAAKIGLLQHEDSRLINSKNNSQSMPCFEDVTDRNNAVSPQSHEPNALNFMRNRQSQDYGRGYENQKHELYSTPGSPLYDNKKAKTAVKADIQDMIQAGYPMGNRDNRQNQYQITSQGMTLTKSYTEGLIENRGAPNNIQSTGIPFESIENSYEVGQTHNANQHDNSAQSLYRKISSQGHMQPSYPEGFDKYQTLAQNTQVDHFPEPGVPIQTHLKLNVANSAHILIEQANRQNDSRIIQRNAVGRHSQSIVGTNANTSNLSNQKSWQQSGSSRPIASKNMPQCFRQPKRPQLQQPQQHQRANSMGAKIDDPLTTKRSFSNDHRYLFQQQNQQRTLPPQIHQSPQLMGNNVQHVLHTAQGLNRRQVLGNTGGDILDFSASAGIINGVAPQSAAQLAVGHVTGGQNANDLSLIHEMFPAFAMAPASPKQHRVNNNHGTFASNGGELWDEDPFKKEM